MFHNRSAQSRVPRKRVLKTLIPINGILSLLQRWSPGSP